MTGPFGTAPNCRRSAKFLSVIETCALLKINPHQYLADVLVRVSFHPQSRVAELTQLLSRVVYDRSRSGLLHHAVDELHTFDDLTQELVTVELPPLALRTAA